MKKRHYEITALVISVLLLLIFTGCKKEEPDARDKLSAIEDKLSASEKESLEEVKEILEKTNTTDVEHKGIPFSDFWAKVKQQGEMWAGDSFYVINIEAGNVIGFDRHQGLAASWEAGIIKCEEIREPRASRIQSRDKYTIYKGKKKIITMSATSKTGGLIIKDDPFPFYGRAFDPKKIKISAEEAERIANKHKDFIPAGFENYDYELKPNEPPDDTPVWCIGKKVNLRKTLEKSEEASERWRVTINAESGRVIE